MLYAFHFLTHFLGGKPRVNELQTENETLQERIVQLEAQAATASPCHDCAEVPRVNELQAANGSLRADNDMLRWHISELEAANEILRTDPEHVTVKSKCPVTPTSAADTGDGGEEPMGAEPELDGEIGG